MPKDMEMMDFTQNKPVDEGQTIDGIPCCRQYHDKREFKLFVYIVFFLLDAADLIVDWMFFYDVATTKSGLAYGPPRDELKYPLLAFSVIGTLVSLFEMANLWRHIFRKNPWCDIDRVKVFVIWIEDVPQLIINVLIAACREEAISYVQLAKACIPIVATLIRLNISLCRPCLKSRCQSCQSFCQSCYKCSHILTIIGLLVSLGCCISIFVFTKTERNPDGSLNLKIPHSIFEGKYDHEKYFANVSVYFSHKIFDHPGQQTEVGDSNILRLLKIDDIKSAPDDLHINVTINNNFTSADYMIEGTGLAMECFTYDKTTNNINIPVKGACPTGFITTPTDAFYFTFHFIKPSPPGLIFGDISYNMKYKNARFPTCQDPNFTIEDEVSDRTDNTDEAALQYYRAAVSDNFHIQHTSPTNGKFYHPKDLIDIKDIWKMGFGYCKCTGSLSPNRDADLLVKC